jgi:hypothetical protein
MSSSRCADERLVVSLSLVASTSASAGKAFMRWWIELSRAWRGHGVVCDHEQEHQRPHGAIRNASDGENNRLCSCLPEIRLNYYPR